MEEKEYGYIETDVDDEDIIFQMSISRDIPEDGIEHFINKIKEIILSYRNSPENDN